MNKKADCVNLDFSELVNPDILHDLDIFPWPFMDEEFEGIIGKDVYEHVLHPIKFMDECWRILKPKGLITLRTNSWNNEQSYTDPTHRRFLTLKSFDYFDPRTAFGSKYFWYTKYKWHLLLYGKDGQELIFKLQKVKK